MPKLSTLALAAVLPTLPACLLGGGGDDDPSPITWRVPCGSQGTWRSGATEHARYAYDARNHPVLTETFAPDGTLRSTLTRGWDRDDLVWSELASASASYRNELAYAAPGRMTRWQRTDRALDDGDDGFTLTSTYADDELVGQLVDWHDPLRPDRRATITGERSTRMTSIECRVDDPADCETWTWDQPDADPAHWTRGTADFTSDGEIDLVLERALDDHGLELSYTETVVEGDQLVLTFRVDTERDPDGTELGFIMQWFEGGALVDAFTRWNEFVCAAPRDAGARGIDRAAELHEVGPDRDVLDRRLAARGRAARLARAR